MERMREGIKQFVNDESQFKLLATVDQLKDHLRMRERYNQDIDQLSKIQRRLQAMKYDRVKQWMKCERLFHYNSDVAQLRH